ncbi:TetR/AcrR family transcriptional regulator [Mycobacterium sp. URHB0044]|jgi:AcrR family transcriptional regulator|uniref:TetR/AcrR family transcriptional regulator n=1 Tax=Mycobacterium sp. URHB0044 TaxID=1380386 RepID=UPI00048CEA26|nr:TetR/AcrR family transcriptional regulator [Mycobacterium sp. URHB0044]
MNDSVKRDYRSTLRAAQAADTRQSIVAAAARLFIADGYGRTTIDGVAESAGVSRKTVFSAVGGKVELLKSALDWAVAGDDEPIAIADRPAIRALLALEDPAALLAGWVRALVEIDVRAASLLHALEVAADGDDDARRLIDEYRAQRLAGARAVVKRLATLDALSENMSRADATDVAWLATDPLLFDRLVRSRGWSVGKFERWLARTLTGQLIQP